MGTQKCKYLTDEYVQGVDRVSWCTRDNDYCNGCKIMKKLLVLAVILLGLSGCREKGDRIQHENGITRTYLTDDDGFGVVMLEVEWKGNKHVFFRHGGEGGIAHWPDCKYCKEDGKHQGNQ